jgi:putative ABC transport system permease protein
LCGGALRALPQVQSVPFELHTSNWVVFFIAALLTLATTFVFGLAPAIRATRADVVTSLKEAGGRGLTALGLSGGLIAAEVALATLLLVGAALTSRSLARLEGEALGFDPARVLVMRAWPGSRLRGSAGLARARALLDNVRGVPGIISAAFVSLPPFTDRVATSLMVEGEPSGDRAAWHQAIPRMVSEGYFRTMRIPIRKGRDFVRADAQEAPVAIINQALARAHFSGRDPIGARIALPEIDTVMWAAHQRGDDVWATVVGVAGDIREIDLGVPPQPTAYLFRDQHPDWLYGYIVARAAISPATGRFALTRIAKQADASMTPSVMNMSDFVTRSVVAPRIRALVLAGFAALALVLASVGIYGVTAHVTAQRTAEIGIRMALGATSRQVLVKVSSRVLSSAAAGLAIGLAAGLLLARLIRAFLYGVGPNDPGTFVLAALLAATIAGLAAWIPARRATRIDPTDALRAE